MIFSTLSILSAKIFTLDRDMLKPFGYIFHWLKAKIYFRYLNCLNILVLFKWHKQYIRTRPTRREKAYFFSEKCNVQNSKISLGIFKE